jgi:hypothetical protein
MPATKVTRNIQNLYERIEIKPIIGSIRTLPRPASTTYTSSLPHLQLSHSLVHFINALTPPSINNLVYSLCAIGSHHGKGPGFLPSGVAVELKNKLLSLNTASPLTSSTSTSILKMPSEGLVSLIRGESPQRMTTCSSLPSDHLIHTGVVMPEGEETNLPLIPLHNYKMIRYLRPDLILTTRQLRSTPQHALPSWKRPPFLFKIPPLTFEAQSAPYAAAEFPCQGATVCSF